MIDFFDKFGASKQPVHWCCSAKRPKNEFVVEKLDSFERNSFSSNVNEKNLG